MDHYIYKSIPDAKFEVDSSFSLGDMMSQNFPQKISTIFKQRKIFSFSKFLGRLDDERAAATP